MEDLPAVLYEKNESVATVTLNRPTALNAFSVRMRDDLYEVLGAVKDDPEVRVVIVRGAGERAFCAGADVSEFLTAPSVVKARRIRALRDLWGLFLSIPQPLVAALHGYVFGSGLEIALFCDIRIASDDVLFGLPEVSLGIIPAAGGTQTLPRVMGLSSSLDMLLTNRRIGADEAYRSGLVSRVVPKAELLPTAEVMARQIASFDPLAVRKAKEAVRRGADLSLPEGLHLEKMLAFELSAARALQRSSKANDPEAKER
jgi:enoyl-CoA hydratase/carnithine racemase